MKRKGVLGQSLTIIISLIFAIMALALLWIFLTGSTNIINIAAMKIVEGFKCGIICKRILGSINADKLVKGMCGGC